MRVLLGSFEWDTHRGLHFWKAGLLMKLFRLNMEQENILVHSTGRNKFYFWIVYIHSFIDPRSELGTSAFPWTCFLLHFINCPSPSFLVHSLNFHLVILEFFFLLPSLNVDKVKHKGLLLMRTDGLAFGSSIGRIIYKSILFFSFLPPRLQWSAL